MTISPSSDSDGSVPEPVRKFERDYFEASDRKAVLDHYMANYQEHADSFMAIVDAAQMLHALGGAGGAPAASVPEALPRGSPLGPYRVVRLIGRGGMGEVYEAVEVPLGRRVAVKTVRRGRASSVGGLVRFERERKTLAKVHHTNIVPIFATGAEGDLLDFSMPYIAGASLDQVVKVARNHVSSGHALSTSSFEELLEEARSRAQSVSVDPSVAALSTVSAGSAAAAAMFTATANDPGPTALRVAETESPAPAPGSPPHPPSMTYVRTAVELMAAVAEGMHHAHESGIVHRDLKPANIMVETGGHAWVLDFGVAGLATRDDAGAQPSAASPSDSGESPEPSLTAGPIGTLWYMSPEQLEDGKRADARSDVWGLGATLYELLTLRRPFPTSTAIQRVEPVAPRRLNPALDRDLQAVVLRALRKDPKDRYATAHDLAEDLTRWLRHEPVQARPARAPRRAAMWARRNKGWAAAIALTMLGLAALAVTFMVAERRQRRQALVERMQRLRLSSHKAGWSDDAWALAREAVGAGANDRVKAEAAATLSGFDAHEIKRFRAAAHALSFHPETGRLLTVGADGRVRDWDPETDQSRDLGPGDPGLIAVRGDGAVLLLSSAKDQRSLELRLVEADLVSRRLTPGVKGDARIIATALTPDGRRAAASIQAPDAQDDRVEVWDTETGRTLDVFAVRQSTSMALSPDGRVVAVGDEEGRIHVRTTDDPREVASLTSGRTRVSALAFGRDPVRSSDTGLEAGAGDWLLASGDVGTMITVWDLRSKAPRSFCRGSLFDVILLAFSPDGMTLASTTRNTLHLWDLASGQMLLTAHVNNENNGLAFSSDGQRFALSSVASFTDPGQVTIWEIDSGRGLRGLRGLPAPVSRLAISRDGKRSAAFSSSWHVAAWDHAAGRLLGVFEGPKGHFADSADLTFSPDGRQLVAAAGHEARLWDVDTGRLVRTWTLPAEGLSESLLYLGPEKLLLARQETAGMKLPPFSEADPREHPRVVRTRNLFGPVPTRPMAEITEINLWIGIVQTSPDGSSVVVEGLSGKPGHVTRQVRAYDWTSGEQTWDLPVTHSEKYPGSLDFKFDPGGSLVAFSPDPRADRPVWHLLTFPGRAFIGDLETKLHYLGPNARMWLNYRYGSVDEPAAAFLYESARNRPILSVPLSTTSFGLGARCSAGTVASWSGTTATGS